MAKFQLSISDAYVKDWGITEGVRELIQNAKDAEQDGYPMTVTHERDRLTITNQGARLDRRVLLLGVTSKSDGNYRGHFGEGLKLGALALTRAGRPLAMINDDETWSFNLEDSEAFGVPVLTVRTRKLPQPTGTFTVQLPMTEEEWRQIRRNFRFLGDSGTVIDAGSTIILEDPEEIGRCYVKGILVETKDDLQVGYDFLCAETDRDRRMVNTFYFTYFASRAWAQALTQGDIGADRFLDLLGCDGPDVRELAQPYLDDDYVLAVADEFHRRHGKRAIPVENSAEALQAGHYGRVGVVSNGKVIDFFSARDCTKAMCLTVLRDQQRTEVTAIHDPSELTQSEFFVYTYVNGLVAASAEQCAFAPPLERLQIVDFSSPEVVGLSTPPSDDPDQPAAMRHVRRLWIARSQLSDVRSYLRALVHEIAHDRGSDGAAGHRDAENELYGAMIIRASGIDWPAQVAV